MKLKDFYASYLVYIGVAAGHFAPRWQSWPIMFFGLIGWIFYFEPKVAGEADVRK